jgi:hypothetical protein
MYYAGKSVRAEKLSAREIHCGTPLYAVTGKPPYSTGPLPVAVQSHADASPYRLRIWPASLSVRLLFQTAVEAEVGSFLCRARHERRDEDGPTGYRNGYQPSSTVKTTMGVELQRPKLRDTDERFCARLFGDGVTRTNALEALVISGWVRGQGLRFCELIHPMNQRDVSACWRSDLGNYCENAHYGNLHELSASNCESIYVGAQANNKCARFLT